MRAGGGGGRRQIAVVGQGYWGRGVWWGAIVGAGEVGGSL